ncbi:MAG: threonine-phosphate decarboxylase CobD [Peptococcaceae bacterium]
MFSQDFIPGHGGNLFQAAKHYGFLPQEIIDFSANINPLGPSAKVIKAITDNLRQIRHYPDPDCTLIRQALSLHLNVPPDNLLVGNGTSELIYLLAETLKIRHALILPPAFSEYARAVFNRGGKVSQVELNEENDFSLPLAELTKAIPGVETLFLCNPNNPTGGLISREELKIILDTAARFNRLVIVDEAFMDFVPQKENYTALPCLDNYPNLIVLYSLTKILAIPGLRLGIVVASSSLIKKLARAKIPWSVNTLAQIAGKAGLEDEEYLMNTYRLVNQEKDFLSSRLNKLPGLRPLPGAANFLLIDITKTGYGVRELVWKLGIKGILVRDCTNFSGLFRPYIRIAVRGREENKALLAALQEILSVDHKVED